MIEEGSYVRKVAITVKVALKFNLTPNFHQDEWVGVCTHICVHMLPHTQNSFQDLSF